MKRLIVALSVAASLAAGSTLLAAATRTVKGEVIDLHCYVKEGVKATGEAHAACAISCAKRGQPVGILTADGAVYEITGEYTKDNNARTIEFVAKQVEVSGAVTEKDGKQYIDVVSMELAK